MANVSALVHPLVHGEKGPQAEAGVRMATYARLYESPPQQVEPLARTWLTRGANFVVAYSQVQAGAALKRDDNADEYMVLLAPEVAATIAAGREQIDARGDSLTIVPPGPSAVTARSAGRIVRVFSNRAADLLERAANAGIYADGAPECAPLTPWPDPVGGFKLRNYYLPDYYDPRQFGCLFRSTNLMINVFERKTVRRDPTKLSPHSHDDFEQASLSLSGRFVHHLRVPWTPNMMLWREDEHVEFDSPSVLIIPARLIHTTQDVGEGETWLVDIFAPPRLDFSLRPGLVRNEAEYPLPPAAAEVRAAKTS
jgi:hypothetical protein